MDERRDERERMVTAQVAARGVTDPAVLAAMRRIPRHLFVPPDRQVEAYDDGPVAIGRGQTISQPYIVGLMSELARPRPGARHLEVGTGCGYQTAVLAECGAEVWTVELEPELARGAQLTLEGLGIQRVHFRVGDGALGWPEAAPFDAIVVTAAPATPPPGLVHQLGVGGRLVIPLGVHAQNLCVITRGPEGLRTESVLPVRFVPLR